MTGSGDVVAVVLNWNSSSDTVRCLEAVRRQDHPVRVLVVDNGSRPGDIERVAAARPDVQILRLERNLGYAGGMNAGLAEAAGSGAALAWLLNADTVPGPHALSGLTAHADRYPMAASRQVTSTAVDSPRKEAYVAAARLGRLGRPHPVTCPGCTGAHDVHIVTGASIMLDVAAVGRLGGFDERFFHYKEEFDLAYRFHRAGLAVGLVCASEVWHARGASLGHETPLAGYYYHRNELLFLRKHEPDPVALLSKTIALHGRKAAAAACAAAVGSSAQRRRYARAQLLGYAGGLRGVTGPAPGPSTLLGTG